jgi:predicted porin
MPILEYAGEGIFGRQEGALYAADSRSARPGRKTVLARLALRQTDKLSYAIGGARNLSTRDLSWAAGVEYKMTDSLKFRGDLRLFSGNDNTEFGRWARNDYFEVGLIYKF